MRCSLLMVCFLLAWTHALRAEDSSGTRAVVVGVTPFTYHPVDAADFLEPLVKRSLETYDIRVESVDAGDDRSAAIFAARPRLDVLVGADVFGSGAGRRVKASVEWRSGADVDLDASGESAFGDIVSAIVENVASRSSLTDILARREAWARGVLEEGTDDVDQTVECLVILGVTARERGAWDEALEHLGRAVELRPDDALLRFDLALVHKGLGDHAAKRTELEHAYALDPHDESISIAVANDALDRGDVDRAVAEYERWLDSPRTSALVRWNLAVARVRQGRYDDARAWLDEIPRESPYFVDARAWSERMARRPPPQPGVAETTSLFALMGLPEGFGETLLTVTLVLSLAGFVWKRKAREGEDAPVIEVGGVKIPRPDDPAAWRVIGPVLFGVSLVLFIPFVEVAPRAEAPALDAGQGSLESLAGQETAARR